MYAPNKFLIRRSARLLQIHYVVHILLVLASVHSMYALGVKALLWIAPVWLIQWYFLNALHLSHFLFCKPRQWRFEHNQTTLYVDDEWHDVELTNAQVYKHCVILTFRYVTVTNQSWQALPHWDVIVFDGCESESFRQLRAMLRTTLGQEARQKNGN